VIAPTMVIITLAMAEMMALIPRPIAEKIEPWNVENMSVEEWKVINELHIP
jgi:hypothetical protein